MSLGTTADYTLTRDAMLTLAHKLIGVLEPGQTLDGEQLLDGVEILNLVVRETDGSGRWRWTFETAFHLPLAANTSVYNSANNLPTNISELVSVGFRDAAGRDVPNLKILKAEAYESIADKIQVGNPQSVYLTEQVALADRTLYCWPTPSSVVAQSVVTGTDAEDYKCIRPHVAAAVTRPVTGANWRMFWELGGSGGSAWVSGSSYTAPQQLRLLYRRPIFDFDTAADTPDFPIPWPRHLVYKVAFDLGDLYSIPIDERNHMIAKAQGAFDDIFPSVQVKANTRRHKVKFY
jgi:hypothetical protein